MKPGDAPEIRITDHGESIGLHAIYDGYKFASASKEARLLSTIEVAEDPTDAADDE